MATYEVQAPDGSILELEGPDNATPEQIGVAAKRAYAASQASTAGAAAPTGRRIASFQRGPSAEDLAAAKAAPKPAAPQEPGLIAQVKEAFTGAARTTPEIEALPDIGKMPERNQFSVAGFKSALGQIAASSPEELVQVIGSNFPDVKARVDAKGNYILQSALDGKEYAIKPGFQASDVAPAIGKAIPQIAAAQLVAPAAAAMGLGSAAQLASSLLTAGAVQTAVEGVSAQTGGQFEPVEIAKAVAGEAFGQGVGAAAKGVMGAAKAAGRAVKQAVKPAAAPVAQAAEQAVEAAVTPAVAEAVGAAAAPAAAVAPAGAQAAQQFMEPTELADMVRKASRGGIGSASAKRELAQFAQFNPEARAQAEALGFELPMDVFADNPQVRAAAGLIRSEAAGAEEAAYTQQLQSAMTRADDLMRDYGATFIEGKPASAEVSDRVLGSITQQAEDLASKAKPLFDEFNARVPKNTKIALPDLADEMATVLETTVPSQLTKAERGLLALVKKGENGELSEIPYGALVREKQAIFDQLNKRVGNKYKDVDQVQLEKYYDILRKEQIAVADRLGDAEASKMLGDANLLWAKKKELDDLVVEGFGKAGDNSVAKLMKSAVKGAVEGDKAAFNKLSKVLDAVPPELRRETVATALASASRSGQKFAGMDPGAFGFSEFTKMYQGLRANPEVYKRVVDALGPGSDETLRRLYEVSKRITDARANVLKTGKANQPFLARLNAERLTDRVINAALHTGSGKMATAALGSAAGGPIGAAIATGLISAAGTKKTGTQVATQMLASEEFKKFAEEAAVREVSPAKIRAFAASPVFAKFANAIGLPRAIEDRDRWIRNALEAQAQQPQEQPTP